MKTTATFDTASINADLRALYEEKIKAILGRLAAFTVPKQRHISYPLFGHVRDAYLRSATRLMFVGQQTQHWWGTLEGKLEEDAILEASSRGYDDALDRKGRPYTTSPFWRAVHEVYARCNPNVVLPADGFFWTNLWKVDDNAGPPRPDLAALLSEHFYLLREEIEILRPHAVLCFTGPYHDPRRFLRENPPDLKRLTTSEPVSWASLSADGPLLIHTYHPNFLRRKGQEYWSRVLDQVVELANQARAVEGAR